MRQRPSFDRRQASCYSRSREPRRTFPQTDRARSHSGCLRRYHRLFHSRVVDWPYGGLLSCGNRREAVEVLKSRRKAHRPHNDAGRPHRISDSVALGAKWPRLVCTYFQPCGGRCDASGPHVPETSNQWTKARSSDCRTVSVDWWVRGDRP